MENNGIVLRKGSWTKEEDNLLKKCIENYGEGKWHKVPLRAGLNRCRKSCRLRWLNYLRPNIKRGNFSKDEVDLIVRLHKLLGNRWSLIAGRLPERTANDVKNFWNTHIEKKLGSKEGGVQDVKVRKTITKSNIIRPQPRTFTKSHVVERSHTKITNDHWTSKDENFFNNFNDLKSSTEKERDECLKWWSHLFHQTELGEDTNINASFSTPGDDNQIEKLSMGLHNAVEDYDEFSRLALDFDGWGLDNFQHDQNFMPFN